MQNLLGDAVPLISDLSSMDNSEQQRTVNDLADDMVNLVARMKRVNDKLAENLNDKDFERLAIALRLKDYKEVNRLVERIARRFPVFAEELRTLIDEVFSKEKPKI